MHRCTTGLRLFMCLVTIFTLQSPQLKAQFTLEGEIRPRAQFFNGARRLSSPNDGSAFVVGQRTRITANYVQAGDFETHISIQDVRVWGDQDQLSDDPSIGVFEAYGILYFTPKITLKAGRQELYYDDGYLLGTLNWREAGRSHDAAILRYQDSTFAVHLGGAYNADGFVTRRSNYTQDYYQNMAWLWARKDLSEAIHVSAIGLRRTFQRANGDKRATITTGGEVGYQGDRLSAKAVGYYQLGTDTLDLTVRAWMASVRLGYKITPALKMQLGTDILSGTDGLQLAQPFNQQNNTFDILYGFRHRHFGTMDFFYLGYTPPQGLIDNIWRTEYRVSKALGLRADLHGFFSQATVLNGGIPPEAMDPYLGTEVDLSFRYRWKPNVQFQGGYSQMWGTPTLARLKGGDPAEVSNWAWFQVLLTPTFLGADN